MEFLTEFLRSNTEDNIKSDYLLNCKKEGNQVFNPNTEALELINKIGGRSYENGLVRIHTVDSSEYWTELVVEYFTEYQDKVHCFAYDWCARQFALGHKNNELTIYMFDPSSGEVYELESDIISFFNVDLVKFRNDTLLEDDFKSLVGSMILDLNKVYGFKKSLFLGGEENLDNMELSDIEVYWEMCRQLYLKTQ